MFQKLVTLAFVLGALMFSAHVRAETEIKDVWVRATAGTGKVTAGYGVIVNSGAVGDQLISVSTSAAMMVDVHQSKHEGGVMKMEPVRGLVIPASGIVELKPGGYHLMIMNVSQPLKAGEDIDLVFTFKNQGPVKVRAKVAPLSASRMP